MTLAEFVTTVGPRNGSLVIVGGGTDQESVRKFIELAGGPQAPILMVPTAEADEDLQFYQYHRGLKPFKKAGATNVAVLHTRNRDVADSDEFVRPIRDAGGIWFTGGRHWRLADAYLHTLAHEEFHALLERGGVVGGTSAGATIQGSFMIRGDTESHTVIAGDHSEGFGFLRNVVIDQHLLVRNRQFDLIQIIESHPELLGIGIDEGTAIVVIGDTFEVIGRSYVAIYDHKRTISPEGKFFFLASGDIFNLKTGYAERVTGSNEPFGRIGSGEWPKKGR